MTAANRSSRQSRCSRPQPTDRERVSRDARFFFCPEPEPRQSVPIGIIGYMCRLQTLERPPTEGQCRAEPTERDFIPCTAIGQTAGCLAGHTSRTEPPCSRFGTFSRAAWASYPTKRRKSLRTAYFERAVFRAKSVASRRPSRARFFIITLLPLTASRWSRICWRKLITYSIYRCHTLSKPKARAYAAADAVFKAADVFSCVPWASYPTKRRKSLRTRVCEGVGEGKKKKPPQWGGFGLGFFGRWGQTLAKYVCPSFLFVQLTLPSSNLEPKSFSVSSMPSPLLGFATSAFKFLIRCSRRSISCLTVYVSIVVLFLLFLQP